MTERRYKTCLRLLAFWTVLVAVIALVFLIALLSEMALMQDAVFSSTPAILSFTILLIGYLLAVFSLWSVVVVPVALLAILFRPLPNSRDLATGGSDAKKGPSLTSRPSAQTTASASDLSRYKF